MILDSHFHHLDDNTVVADGADLTTGVIGDVIDLENLKYPTSMYPSGGPGTAHVDPGFQARQNSNYTFRGQWAPNTLYALRKQAFQTGTGTGVVLSLVTADNEALTTNATTLAASTTWDNTSNTKIGGLHGYTVPVMQKMQRYLGILVTTAGTGNQNAIFDIGWPLTFESFER